MDRHWIHSLLLENEKFFIIKTPTEEINYLDYEDFEFVRRNPIIGFDTIGRGDGFFLDTTVLRYMGQHGIDNVRGGSFCGEITGLKRYFIQRMICTGLNTCHYCEGKHWTEKCPLKKTVHSASLEEENSSDESEQYSSESNSSDESEHVSSEDDSTGPVSSDEQSSDEEGSDEEGQISDEEGSEEEEDSDEDHDSAETTEDEFSENESDSETADTSTEDEFSDGEDSDD